MDIETKANLIVAVTGCDGVGKSTAVSSLSKLTGYPTRHFDKPKNLEDGKNQYFTFASNNREPIICDRFHDGEWVYAPIYRGYIADYLKEIEKVIVTHNNFLQVYVKASLETIIDRTRRRGEDFVKEEHFELILDYFEKFMEKQTMPYIIVDTTTANTEDCVTKIKANMDKVEIIWNQLRDFNEKVPKMMTDKLIFPRGKMDGQYMVVTEIPTADCIDKYSTIWSGEQLTSEVNEFLKRFGIYNDCWLTSLVPFPTIDNKVNKQQIEKTNHMIKTQYELIQPQKVITFNQTTANYLKEILQTDIEIKNLEG